MCQLVVNVCTNNVYPYLQLSMQLVDFSVSLPELLLKAGSLIIHLCL